MYKSALSTAGKSLLKTKQFTLRIYSIPAVTLLKFELLILIFLLPSLKATIKFLIWNLTIIQGMNKALNDRIVSCNLVHILIHSYHSNFKQIIR